MDANNSRFREKILLLVAEIGKSMGMTEYDTRLQMLTEHYKNIDSHDEIIHELKKNISSLFSDNNDIRNSYIAKLDEVIDSEKFQKEMFKYGERMKSFLPAEKKAEKMKRSGHKLEEIISELGNDSYIFDYVPDVLYHGSVHSLDVINPNESTQKGSCVYATDNPTHALFFSIFRNSSIARAHIHEYIDENGEYKVKYQIDERVQGALDNIISDKEITIHVCDGKDFLKPKGEAYIGREYISKAGQSVVPTDRIHVNVKRFFENLEKQGLVEYDNYDKSKDWKTVIDMLGVNYAFGLGTSKGMSTQEYDKMYDDFIGTKFPEQFEFSKQFRRFAREVMETDFKSNDPEMTLEEENNYKLRYIKTTANSFLKAEKNENEQIVWSVDQDKINAFLNPERDSQERKPQSM